MHHVSVHNLHLSEVSAIESQLIHRSVARWQFIFAIHQFRGYGLKADPIVCQSHCLFYLLPFFLFLIGNVIILWISKKKICLTKGKSPKITKQFNKIQAQVQCGCLYFSPFVLFSSRKIYSITSQWIPLW